MAKSSKAVTVILTNGASIKAAWASIASNAAVVTEAVARRNDTIAEVREYMSQFQRDTMLAMVQLHHAGEKAIPANVDAALRDAYTKWNSHKGAKQAALCVRQHMFVWNTVLKTGKKPAKKTTGETIEKMASEDVTPKAGEYAVKVTELTSEEAFRETMRKWCNAVKLGSKSEGVQRMAAEFLDVISE